MQLDFLFDRAWSDRWLWTLGHFLWQGTLVVLLPGAVARGLRRAPAQMRYAVHLAALLLMLVCVPGTWFCYGLPFSLRTACRLFVAGKHLRETESAARLGRRRLGHPLSQFPEVDDPRSTSCATGATNRIGQPGPSACPAFPATAFSGHP
jgi:hypothetical protein